MPTENNGTSEPRAQLLDMLRKRAAQGADAGEALSPNEQGSEKKETAEYAEPAKHTALSRETEMKQTRNGPETEASHFKSAPGSQPGSSSSEKSTANLEDLPLEIQNRILDLVESKSLDAATLEVTTKKPYGLGINTNRSAIYRFHQRHQSARLAAHRDELARDATDLMKKADATDAEFSRATQHLVKLRLLEAAMASRINPANILSLTRSLDRLRAADHSERRLRIAEKKAERDSAIIQAKVPSP